MRGEYSDERDSTWERDDPRFRIYLFEGASNSVTTLDVFDATIEEALEAAHAMSEGDQHLWSLALVENNAAGRRGLLWLSGMDYNDTPSTAREWKHRRQMQDRYLQARSIAKEPTVLPNGLRVIRVFPEWGSGWPLWENYSDDYRLTGPSLGLSPVLSDALYAWNEIWQARPIEEPLADAAGWHAEGRRLAQHLQAELQGIAEVRLEFLPDEGNESE
jgi:hypothetical protein